MGAHSVVSGIVPHLPARKWDSPEAASSPLQAGLEEKARADAERADRMQAQYEAEQDSKAARERERRQDETRMRVNTLKQQVGILRSALGMS